MSAPAAAEFEIVRHPTARRIRLTLDPASGRARLIVPKRAALKSAVAWAQGKAEWIAEQRARLPQPRPFAPGLVLTVADTVLTIDWQPGSRRRVETIGETLSLSGPIETLPRRVETWLKRQALELLTEETAYYAARAGVTVARVAIGDPRGRWGSCAHDGAIRYSWRLILAPGFVRRATVAHEVAHRVHMNHAPAFHALVAQLYGEDPTPARAWLREHGAALHWVGRSS
ncbi:M48 family metallopeptidase [Sphingomonas sp. CV7422]|uniref:M48 family metallopeptidase n=1 Tax=Sphingomonas sp. CV7422 TaxID=3018036 RepID=UPI0022FECCB1|nr:SprT family zinc-dependent metalloprotease [Sphingomonas sp. CV7422]